MSATKTVRKSEVADCRDYTKNLNQREDAREEAKRYGGQFVARSCDGKTVFAYAKTWDELESRLQKLGIDPATVVFGRVMPLDTALLG